MFGVCCQCVPLVSVAWSRTAALWSTPQGHSHISRTPRPQSDTINAIWANATHFCSQKCKITLCVNYKLCPWHLHSACGEKSTWDPKATTQFNYVNWASVPLVSLWSGETLTPAISCSRCDSRWKCTPGHGVCVCWFNHHTAEITFVNVCLWEGIIVPQRYHVYTAIIIAVLVLHQSPSWRYPHLVLPPQNVSLSQIAHTKASNLYFVILLCCHISLRCCLECGLFMYIILQIHKKTLCNRNET